MSAAAASLLSDYSKNVVVRQSEIDNSVEKSMGETCDLEVGLGLFAKKNISKGSLICLYSGELIEAADAKFVDPSYTVNFENGRGLKLIGKSICDAKGYLGHIANSVHPSYELPIQNAKLAIGKKFATDSHGQIKRKYAAGDFGYFPLVAISDIKKGDEIIVDYSKGYWKTLLEWLQNPKIRPQADLDRAERLKRRAGIREELMQM
mmetsp:Transcript_19972/g.28611  ORF Transcript_19972/g.28611 Transcript_19972/m.28611 type:complete len:206 (+) Transcript_19972:1509-2126(+)|eukprot:CAMPEP_0201105588 /NCGR_PEP_ID=MMETSP0812-20130820/46784_1 /ASSEMBLY_ACC=CAM_ASM_000668 /TAXON_ID=98059 /ORGANISM="Dinobryon sp., Strain UTEXLB2267" /LENGTH=205 /DNA_ID=CAMNT_0047365533 /DNA_START=27 /DNA_END=644 /DNA_ORIENTATION=+